MKIIGIAISVIIILGVIYMYNQQSDGSSKAIDFQTVQADIASGGRLIDVRSPEEYATGHINGAINLDVVAIEAGGRPQVAKHQKLYLYCRSGARSGRATSMLTSAGFTNIVDLGAMTNVQAMGAGTTN